MVPDDANMISSTWTMKKKSDVNNHKIFNVRLNARGFDKGDCVNYTKDDVLAQVVNEITIQIVFILMILNI